ncbi:hypothetical protein AB0C50_22160 [Micromonospora taraxaci]|uniref:hypothetical protein n=1 Tax=Micromonospora taraxaci TaxID=1316803 RepID=UPI0033ED651E
MPEALWRQRTGLLPILVDAALASHPAAVATLRDIAAGDATMNSSEVSELVLNRLQHSAASSAPKAGAAFGYLIDHAEATSHVSQLCAVLRKSTTATVQLQPDQHNRMVALRLRLVRSTNKATVQSGYILWRLLVQRLIDSLPEPEHLARALADSPGAHLLTSVLEFALCCVRSSDWADRDPSSLATALEAVITTTAARTSPRHSYGTVTRPGRKATPYQEGLTRPALIAVQSRLTPLPTTPALRRAAARRGLGLLWNAGYDISDQAGLIDFTKCMRKLAPLVRRFPDKATAVDLLLDVAARLHADQRKPTRWRERSTGEWFGAVVTTVRGASDSDRRRLVTGLLRTDGDMAGGAIRACVDHLSPPPPWLANL